LAWSNTGTGIFATDSVVGCLQTHIIRKVQDAKKYFAMQKSAGKKNKRKPPADFAKNLHSGTLRTRNF